MRWPLFALMTCFGCSRSTSSAKGDVGGRVWRRPRASWGWEKGIDPDYDLLCIVCDQASRRILSYYTMTSMSLYRWMSLQHSPKSIVVFGIWQRNAAARPSSWMMLAIPPTARRSRMPLPSFPQYCCYFSTSTIFPVMKPPLLYHRFSPARIRMKVLQNKSRILLQNKSRILLHKTTIIMTWLWCTIKAWKLMSTRMTCGLKK